MDQRGHPVFFCIFPEIHQSDPPQTIYSKPMFSTLREIQLETGIYVNWDNHQSTHLLANWGYQDSNEPHLVQVTRFEFIAPQMTKNLAFD